MPLDLAELVSWQTDGDFTTLDEAEQQLTSSMESLVFI